jgi:hypothetical protein
VFGLRREAGRTHTALKRLVRAFRDGILEGEDPEGYCYVVSAPLEAYLRLTSIRCTLVRGSVHKEINCHYWLELPDGTIIDATASQLRRPNGRAMPYVYVGPLPAWYAVEGREKV